MRIAFTTLGCKINQSETDAMRQEAAAAGNAIVPFECKADVYVVNTCSVTAKTDYQCRQAIRAAVRRAGGGRVIVTGCYAQTRPDEIRGIPGVSLVIGNAEKGGLAKHLSDSPATGADPVAGPAGQARSRTRRFLKVQDGCDSKCAYCIVPLARGGSRSVPVDDVLSQFDKAVGDGCPEIVLSGIHIGRYGSDLEPQENLAGMVRRLLGRRQDTRLRLSSIEPNEVSEDIVELIGKGLCRHLHIPLQSGSDAILRSMNRNYSVSDYRMLVTGLASRVPDIALGADVMVGFPGEGGGEFRDTCDLIRELPLSHLHVFSYSPRPGTIASGMKGQVPDKIKKARSETLRSLAHEKNSRFRERMIGKVLSVVLEDSEAGEGRAFSGLSDNYLRISVQGAEKRHLGRLINVLVTEVDEGGLSGIIHINQ